MFFSENNEQSDEESDENSYEEIFDQILGGLKKPKLNSLWEHSNPNSPIPVSPLGSPPNGSSSIGSPSARRHETAPKHRPKVPTPENPVFSRIFPSIRRCGSDDYGLRSSPSSPKGDLKLKSSIRFTERRFSDVTSPFSPGYETIQAKKRFNYQGAPQVPPPPVPKHASKRNSKPLMVARGYEEQIAKDDDVFHPNSELLKVFT